MSGAWERVVFVDNTLDEVGVVSSKYTPEVYEAFAARGFSMKDEELVAQDVFSANFAKMAVEVDERAHRSAVADVHVCHFRRPDMAGRPRHDIFPGGGGCSSDAHYLDVLNTSARFLHLATFCLTAGNPPPKPLPVQELTWNQVCDWYADVLSQKVLAPCDVLLRAFADNAEKSPEGRATIRGLAEVALDSAMFQLPFYWSRHWTLEVALHRIRHETLGGQPFGPDLLPALKTAVDDAKQLPRVLRLLPVT